MHTMQKVAIADIRIREHDAIHIDPHIRGLLMPLRDDERNLLEQSVLAEGIRDPLVLWKRADGERILLDGHHRYELAQKHGLDFEITELEFETEDDAILWVLQNQLARRNLTDEQRAVVLGRLYNQLKLKQGRPDEKVVNLTTFSGSAATARSIATLQGVGERTVRRAAEFAEAVDAVAEIKPEAAERFLAGEIKDAKTALPKVESELLPKVAELISNPATKTVKDAVRHIKRREAELQAVSDADLPPTIQLRVGDFREVLSDLPSSSVDAIITDPPYPAEYVPLFDDLGAFAARVLKPHGVLVVMCGQAHLPEYLRLLSQHLQYRWLCTYAMHDRVMPVHGAKIGNACKPILLYTRHDAQNLRFVPSDYFGAAVGTADGVQKTLHHWQQSLAGFTEIVQRFTEPGELVVDPFLGSGTTAVACLQLNRQFIGCDTDAGAVAIARRRVQEAYKYGGCA